MLMQSFLATSNHQYVQALNMKPSTYTFRATVKSSSGKYAFALMVAGSWMFFEVPTNTTNWRLINHTFTLEQPATSFSLVGKYASSGAPIEVFELMLEEGRLSSTPRIHELDVAEAITTAKEDAELAAKAYSDAQDNLAKIAANAYADGIVDAEEARAIADATNKANAAKTYADAQDLVMKATVQAYADGVVSNEEAARIAQANANLQAAKNYSDAQDNLAKIAANAYADGIVDAEEARAIADATAKMNSAKSHADTLAGNLQGQIDGVASTVGSHTSSLSTLNSKTDWMSPTTIPGLNAFAAGNFAVGNPTDGVNAVLTGLGGSGDVFIAGGIVDVTQLDKSSFYAKRNGEVFMRKARIASSDGNVEWELENGIQRWFDVSVTPKRLRRQLGWDATGPKDQTFGADGTLLYEFTAGGFKNYAIPAKTTAVHLLSLSALNGITTSDSTLANAIKSLIKNYRVKFPDQFLQDVDGMTYLWYEEYWALYLKQSQLSYKFDSGTESTLDQYEGYRTKGSLNPPSESGNTFIMDGWYVGEVSTFDPPDPQNPPTMDFDSPTNADWVIRTIWRQADPQNPRMGYYPPTQTFYVTAMFIQNGKQHMTKSVAITMTMSEYQSLSR